MKLTTIQAIPHSFPEHQRPYATHLAYYPMPSRKVSEVKEGVFTSYVEKCEYRC